MDKIIKIIRKYKKLIILFLIIYFIKKLNKIEKMSCDFDRPKLNYFLENSSHILDELQLKNKEKFLKKIFIFDTNKNIYKKDNKTLEEFLIKNNIYDNKINFIKSVNILLNNNRIWDNYKDYKISENTKISEIRHIWLVDKLMSDLNCKIKSNKLLSKVRQLLNDKSLKMCDKNNFLNL